MKINFKAVNPLLKRGRCLTRTLISSQFLVITVGNLQPREYWNHLPMLLKSYSSHLDRFKWQIILLNLRFVVGESTICVRTVGRLSQANSPWILAINLAWTSCRMNSLIPRANISGEMKEKWGWNEAKTQAKIEDKESGWNQKLSLF